MNQHFNQSAFEAEPFSGLPDIPALNELELRRQWVAWGYVERDGKMTKPPVNPRNGSGASHSDPATWGTYEEAAKCAIERGLAGVGYVLTDDDDVTGVDLDKCRDDEFGMEAWAQEIVAMAETYTEVSPSGRGLRLIWRGKIDKTIKCDPAHVEVYRDRRFLTITGTHIEGTPLEIRPAPRTEAALRDRVEQFKPAPATPPHKPNGIISAALAQLPPSSGGDFFRSVNTAALQNPGRWVPDLFGSMAKLQPGTGVWRVSSRNLGRNLQEDLSIAPTGIVDFGVADMGDRRHGKRTAIDLVIEHGGKNATDAAFWLCDRLGIGPAMLGWRGRSDTGSGAGAQSSQEQAPPPPLIQAMPYQWVDPQDVALRDWLYARHILRKFVTATAAGGATGKTTNAVVETLVLVTGKPLLGITPTSLCRVWLWNLEDPYEEMVRKIQAACLFYGITKEDIGDRLFLNSGRDTPLVIAEPGPNGTKILRPITDAFIREAKANRIDVTYVDPFVSCSTVPENDNVGQDKVVKEWGRVADVCNMGVHLLDHTRKAGADEEPSVESVRGGKAKTDACRSVRVLVKMTKKEAEDAGIENPRLYYRAFDGKPNLSYPVEKSEWYKLNNVSLGNGRDGKPSDEMGVVSRWTYPDALADVTASDWDKCAAAIKVGTWRAHHSSNRWVGNCIAQVMGLDVAQKADRKKVTKLISLWKAAGSLIEYEDLDENSEKRQFIRVRD
jgi:hypothetical protein